MITAKAKEWGNSIGVIIPRDVVEKLNIHPGDEISLDIGKKDKVLRELYGFGKFKEPTDKLIKRIRKGLDSRY